MLSLRCRSTPQSWLLALWWWWRACVRRQWAMHVGPAHFHPPPQPKAQVQQLHTAAEASPHRQVPQQSAHHHTHASACQPDSCQHYHHNQHDPHPCAEQQQPQLPLVPLPQPLQPSPSPPSPVRLPMRLPRPQRLQQHGRNVLLLLHVRSPAQRTRHWAPAKGMMAPTLRARCNPRDPAARQPWH